METNKTRSQAYHGVNITKARFQNCLLPLYEYGEGTAKDISESIKVPINRISGRFSECAKRGFIHVSFAKPTKLQDGYHSTNYILTEKGKQIVKDVINAMCDEEISKGHMMGNAFNNIISNSFNTNL